MPRHLRGTTWKTFADQFLRRLIAFAADRAAVLVFHLGAAGFQLLHAHQHALQNVQRLKAGDDNRHVIFRREGQIFLEAHHRADVAGGEKTLHAAVGDDRIASMAGGTSTCEMSSEKFFSLFCAA